MNLPTEKHFYEFLNLDTYEPNLKSERKDFQFSFSSSSSSSVDANKYSQSLSQNLWLKS